MGLELASHDDTCCAFGDIADRLPQFARDWIEAAMPLPAPSMSSAEIKDAYADIKNWILLHKENLFSDSAGSWCYKHKQVCPAHPLLSIGDDAKCLASSLQGVNRPLMVNVAGASCTPHRGLQKAPKSRLPVHARSPFNLVSRAGCAGQ